MSQQLRLFDPATVEAAPITEADRALLDRYRAARIEEHAAVRTVEAELGQLRTLRLDLIRAGRVHCLADILDAPDAAGRVLIEPFEQRSESTMRTRLRAVQRLLSLDVTEGESRRRIEALDMALVRRRSRGWHDAGIMVGGKRARVSQRLTLSPAGLLEIFEVATAESPEATALAGVLCFSAVPLDEICRLRWKDLVWARTNSTVK